MPYPVSPPALPPAVDVALVNVAQSEELPHVASNAANAFNSDVALDAAMGTAASQAVICPEAACESTEAEGLATGSAELLGEPVEIDYSTKRQYSGLQSQQESAEQSVSVEQAIDVTTGQVTALPISTAAQASAVPASTASASTTRISTVPPASISVTPIAPASASGTEQLASSQPNRSDFASGATTFLQLPDLDALLRARLSQSSRANVAALGSNWSESASNASSSSERITQARLDRLARIRQIVAQQTAQAVEPDDQSGDQSDFASPNPVNAPAEAGAAELGAAEPEEPTLGQESIRLDLPIPSEGSSPRPVPQPNAQPALPAPRQPTLQPSPDPTSGEIITIPTPDQPQPEGEEPGSPDPAAGSPTVRPEGSVPIDPQAVGEVLEVRGDRQEFFEREQVFRADGNVEVRFRQAVLTADRVRVNIPNRVAVAEGNAVLTRGDQVLRGERFSYNFGTNQGAIQTARGELLLPAAERDFDPTPPTDVGTSALNRPVTSRIQEAQPLVVQGGVPGPSFGIGDSAANQGNINRLRFEADQAVFNGSDLVAENVRITNDPFSPPELELRSSRVTYRRLSPFTAEIRARNPRLVFDQGFSLPLLVNRLVLDNRRRDSGLLNFGFDERDRDGFYVERTFNIYDSPLVSFSLTPQILVQRAIQEGNIPSADQFGLVANLDFNFTPSTTARAVASFSSLDFSEIEDNLRASLRVEQRVFAHTITAEYSYRDRLFNGSLGFQNVQSSIGLVVASPRYVLGDSLINLRYQAGVQYINAATDRSELFALDRNDRDLSCVNPDERETTGNGCADLTRYQGAVTLSRFFPLWFGRSLPPTPTEGLRYSPTPVTPYVGIYTEVRGVYSGYSNGESQATLRGGATLLGQFGNFSRPFFDYTAFSLGYYNTLVGGESPFFFDRSVDNQFVTASLTQQIYGPLRAGVQVSYNLDTGDEIDTIYTLEYARRTYSISASYSSGRRSATLTFRLNDFNWTGDPGPFSGLGSDVVESGVIRRIN